MIEQRNPNEFEIPSDLSVVADPNPRFTFYHKDVRIELRMEGAFLNDDQIEDPHVFLYEFKDFLATEGVFPLLQGVSSGFTVTLGKQEALFLSPTEFRFYGQPVESELVGEVWELLGLVSEPYLQLT